VIDLKKLKEPFNESDIEWRVQNCGEKKGKIWALVLAYITNRAIMDRLDNVVGAFNWKNEFVKAPNGGLICRLSIKNSNGEWVTKEDGADNTDIEEVKGGLSSAMKRAAVHWGIGRYLYKLENNFAIISDNGKYTAKTKNGQYFKWDPPQLPVWATQKKENKKYDELEVLKKYPKTKKEQQINNVVKSPKRVDILKIIGMLTKKIWSTEDKKEIKEKINQVILEDMEIGKDVTELSQEECSILKEHLTRRLEEKEDAKKDLKELIDKKLEETNGQ
jgi:hypothetical protein